MADKIYTFSWNCHKATFFDVLGELREQEAYTDATIVCDGAFFPVHKLVLSAGSEYFQEIFARVDCKAPVIVLKDVSASNMKFLLDYIYIGRVNVQANEMANLIQAAEYLKIRGLAVPDMPSTSSFGGKAVTSFEPDPKRFKCAGVPTTFHFANSNQSSKPAIDPNSSLLHIETIKDKNGMPVLSSNFLKNMDVHETKPVIRVTSGKYISTKPIQVNEPPQQVDIQRASANQEEICENPEINWEEEVQSTEAMIDKPIERQIICSEIKKETRHMAMRPKATKTNDGKTKCPLCDSTFKMEKYLTNHMKIHNGEKPHGCDFCDFRSAQSGVLTRHMRKHTGEKPFACEYCSYRATQRSALVRHTKLKHYTISLVEPNTN